MKVRKSSIIVAIVLVVAMVFILSCICAEAKTPRNGMDTDRAGNTYIYKHGRLQTGWVHYKGNVYYAHKTSSVCYPKGSICKSTYRIRGERMYYFDGKGKRLKKDSRYISLNKASKSVHYIYSPGIGGRRYRYNANHRRYQYLRGKGKWTDTGMQCWPYGMVDWQE